MSTMAKHWFVCVFVLLHFVAEKHGGLITANPTDTTGNDTVAKLNAINSIGQDVVMQRQDAVMQNQAVVVQNNECFPGNAAVSTKYGRQIMMSQLAIGDEVMTLDVATQLPKIDYVMAFSHRVPAGSRNSSYTCLTLERGDTMCATPLHLICIPKSDNNVSFAECQYVFAKDIEPGCTIVQLNPSLPSAFTLEKVLNVTTEYADRGLYSPITASGTLVVDGVLASCYATIPSHMLAHWLWSPLRVLHSAYSYFGLNGFQHAFSSILEAGGEMLWWGTFTLTQHISIG